MSDGEEVDDVTGRLELGGEEGEGDVMEVTEILMGGVWDVEADDVTGRLEVGGTVGGGNVREVTEMMGGVSAG